MTLQWREAHEGEFLRRGVDPFREPLANFRLLLVRQFDPAGTKQPVDDLEVVAQTVGSPRRLDQSASSATYEISLDYRVAQAGRYAILVGRESA